MAETIATPTRAPRPDLPRPEVAWPTVWLAAGMSALWVVTAWGGVAHGWSLWLTVPVQATAMFAMFTVLHDAAHKGTGRSSRASELLGRFAELFVAPHASFAAFRWLHLTHHGYVNEGPDKDPDDWVTHGPLWKLVPRWPLVDLHYLSFYLRNARRRPTAEKVELAVMFTLATAVLVAIVVAGHGRELLLFWVIPHRIALTVLSWWFDWLPHHGLDETNKTNRYATTRTIVGAETVLTPLLFSQNYHALHHIHPIVPFYKYIEAWRQDEAAYLERGAPLVTPTMREVDPAEHLAAAHR